MFIYFLRTPYIGIIVSSILLVLAFYFEYFSNLTPCKLCLWQRWVHFLIIFSCFLSIVLYSLRELLLFFAGAFSLISFVIASWHSGIELGLFVSPKTCFDNFSSLNNIKFHDFLNKPIISCKDVLWSFLGFSMASWNAIISLALSIFIYSSLFLKGKVYGKK